MMEERGPGETEVLAALLGISEMAGGLTEVDELLTAIVRISPQLVNVDRCLLFTYDEDTGLLEVANVFSPHRGEAEQLRGVSFDARVAPKLFHRVVEERLASLTKESGIEEYLPPFLVDLLKVKSALIVPLSCKQRTLGAMILDDTQSAHYFTSKEINVISGIANQAAIALDSWHLANDLKRTRNGLMTLCSQIADGALVLDAGGRVLDLDSEAHRLLGKSLSDTRGKDVDEVLQAADTNGQRLNREMIYRIAREGGEGRFVCKNDSGKEQILVVRPILISGDSNGVLGYVLLIRSRGVDNSEHPAGEGSSRSRPAGED